MLQKGIGLGTFPFANPFTPISKDEVNKVVSAFLDFGGKYIDTAPTYAFGETERVVGQALRSAKKANRKDYFLASMCGYVLDENNQYKVSGKHKDVIADCESSLQRLQVDYLDLYMSHLPDPNTPFEETVGALVELKKQGKVKYIGVSNVSLEQLKEYNKNREINFVENRFSLLNRAISPDFFEYCSNSDINIIVFQVIERGLLTNKVIEGLSLREGDLRNKKPEFGEDIRSRIALWVAEYLKPIADDLSVTVSALALWWTLQQPGITICLNGATSHSQLHDNFRAMSLKPAHGTLERIERAYQTLESQLSEEYSKSVREFMGLAQYNIYKGSNPSGKR